MMVTKKLPPGYYDPADFTLVHNSYLAKLKASAAREGDNHHNALTCPYCNPKGLTFANPAVPGDQERP